jgi:hypothetical protein
MSDTSDITTDSIEYFLRCQVFLELFVIVLIVCKSRGTAILTWRLFNVTVEMQIFWGGLMVLCLVL